MSTTEERGARKRKLDFYFTFLFPLEVCCSLRFVTFPIVLIRLFGSPRYMNFPLMLWAFVYYATMFIVLLNESTVRTFLKKAGLDRTEQNLANADYTETRHSEASIVLDGDEDGGRGTAIEIIDEQHTDAEAPIKDQSSHVEEATPRKNEENAMPSAPLAPADPEEVVVAQPVVQSDGAMQLASVESIRESEDEDTLYFSSKVVATTLFIVNFLDLMLSFFLIISSLILAFGIFSQSNFGTDKNLDPAWRTEYYLTSTGMYLSIISIVQHLAMFFVVSPLGRCCASICSICSRCCPDHVYDTRFRSWTLSPGVLRVQKFALVLFALFTLTAFGFLCSYANEGRVRAARGSGVKYSGCELMIDGGGEDGLCMYPFPSMHYLGEDSTTPTGFRVHVNSDTTAPPIKNGGRLSLDFLTDSYYDGFSVTGALLWYIPGFVDDTVKANGAADQLVSETDLSPAWSRSSLLIRNGTEGEGQLHPHFCQVDYLAAPTESRACYCQPARALDYDTHYTVVIKNLVDIRGNSLPASPLLQDYIDAYRSGNYVAVAGDAPGRYDRFSSNIFPLLESNGVNLDDVQLVFDFHTISYNSSTRLVRSLHDMAMGKMEHAFGGLFDPQGHVEAGVERDYSAFIERVNTGSTFSGTCPDQTHFEDEVGAYAQYKVKVPSILQNHEYTGVEVIDQLRSRGHNNPHQSGKHTLSIDNYGEMPLAEAMLVVAVPCSVATGQVTLNAVVQWGHGLFGDRTQAATESLRKMANDEGWVLWGMDWRGFDRFGFPLLARQLVHDGGTTLHDIYYNLVQSFLSQISVRSFTMDKLLVNDKSHGDDFLQIKDSDRARVIAGSVPHYFMGGSMGGILGGGYMHAAGVTKGVLYTAGSPFTFLLGRSSLFAAFLPAVDLQFYNRKDARLAITVWQSIFDEAETATWAQGDPVNSSRQRDVLLVAALGDSVVVETSTAIMSRTLNASLITPSVESISVLPSGSTTDIDSAAFTTEMGSRALFLASYPEDAEGVRDNARGTPKRQPNNGVHSCFPTIDVARGIAANFIRNVLINYIDCGSNDDGACYLDDECGT